MQKNTSIFYTGRYRYINMINATVNSGDTHRYNRYRGRYWLFEVRGNQKNQNVFFLPSFLWNIGLFFLLLQLRGFRKWTDKQNITDGKTNADRYFRVLLTPRGPRGMVKHEVRRVKARFTRGKSRTQKQTFVRCEPRNLGQISRINC